MLPCFRTKSASIPDLKIRIGCALALEEFLANPLAVLEVPNLEPD
jgi:hypothetical protein